MTERAMASPAPNSAPDAQSVTPQLRRLSLWHSVAPNCTIAYRYSLEYSVLSDSLENQ